MSSEAAPRDFYLLRRRERVATVEVMDARQNRLANARLATFLTAVVLAILWFGPDLIAAWWFVVPLAIFIPLLVLHDRAIRRRDAARAAVDFYDRGIGRIEDRWAGLGSTGSRFISEGHPYAEDLDLFGPASLFELLSTARTPEGESALASWLLSPAPRDVVLARQAALAELRDRLDLREDLWALGTHVRSETDAASLIAWATAPPMLLGAGGPRFLPPALRGDVIAAVLSAITVAVAASWWVIGLSLQWILLPLGASSVFALIFRSRVRRVVATLDRSAHELETIVRVLERFERERFESPLLQTIRRRLDTGGVPPSRRVARLQRFAELLDWAENQFFGPFAAALLWRTQIAFAIERWRQDAGPHVEDWLQAMGELEALCSLSCYAYEHPADPLPEIAEHGAWFEGEAIGHPLLPADRLVRNDVALGDPTRVLIVSGSNMSGKSTLLRTVGINTVLALAGAPVRASRLRVSPLSVGASIRIHDSLHEGRSRFYAEILRLRQLVELASGPRPLLFLLDEVLHGTNSHDRQVGAAAVVRGLIERGAIGLVTTHDLALASMADDLEGRAINVHFEDRLVDGEIQFDYRMRPGIVRSSNALALMRAVGLDVPEE